jgi:hypothetical protein
VHITAVNYLSFLTMNNAASSASASVFRTEAWVQAWIDTWGKDPRIYLIDLGGRNNPLEQVYLIKHRLKKILPVSTLCLAGVGYGAMSTPRAEYNDLDALIKMAGGIDPLRQELSRLKWQQFVITDIDTSTPTVQQIEQLATNSRWAIHTEKPEPAYAIRQTNFDDYLKGLGSNTRLAYFNRRERLAQQGEIAFIEYALQESADFFAQLNQFHLKRWGSPCYSVQSQAFMKNFAERLAAAGGKVIMQGLAVNGELVSVLFDVIWGNTRYNLQSGYAENRFNKIALGSLHFGYAIQAALEQGQDYDFMAGRGKSKNYKKSISNFQSEIRTVLVERGLFPALRAGLSFIR